MAAHTAHHMPTTPTKGEITTDDVVMEPVATNKIPKEERVANTANGAGNMAAKDTIMDPVVVCDTASSSSADRASPTSADREFATSSSAASSSSAAQSPSKDPNDPETVKVTEDGICSVLLSLAATFVWSTSSCYLLAIVTFASFGPLLSSDLTASTHTTTHTARTRTITAPEVTGPLTEGITDWAPKPNRSNPL